MTIPIFIPKNALFIYVFLGLSPNKEKQNIKLCDFYSCACAFVAKWFLIGFSPRLRVRGEIWFLVVSPLRCGKSWLWFPLRPSRPYWDVAPLRC